MRVFSYPGHRALLQELLGRWAEKSGIGGHRCLVRDEAVCQQSTFIHGNTRCWTAELPIWYALTTKCPQVARPEDADVFVVPFLWGMATSIFWGKYNGGGAQSRTEGRALIANASALFQGLRPPHPGTQTWARHVFLSTLDVEFVPDQFAVNNTLSRATVIHLGDDHATAPGLPGRCRGKLANKCSADKMREWIQKHRMAGNDLVVPYRLTAWLPLGFPPQSGDSQGALARELARSSPRAWSAPSRRVATATSTSEDKPLLLFVNVNLAKHPSRVALDAELRRAVAARGLTRRVHMAKSMVSVREAAARSLRARFCLCPTGDSKGLTGRFYFSLLHACIPVRYDGWYRGLNQSQLALPFRHRIDWDQAMINHDPRMGGAALLARLAEMPDAELEQRTAYIKAIAPMLTYNTTAPMDAAALVVEQLEFRIGALQKAV